MGQFISTETLIIGLLLIASLVALAVRRFRIPYTVALVVVGLPIIFRSPIGFEAAFHLNLTGLDAQLSEGPASIKRGDIATLFCKQQQTEDIENVLMRGRGKRASLKRMG